MRLLIIGLLLFSLYSCKNEKVEKQINIKGNKILIANEGNFGWGEGTLSVYHPDDQSIDNEVYEAINEETLGNVFQSIAFINNEYYFVINNSAKIVVCDSALNYLRTISGFNSPRNIYQVSHNKAYVTDLYSDKLWIVDLISATITGSIAINGWLESAIMHGNQFIVGGMETDYIYMIDIASNSLTDSMEVAYANQSLCIEDNGAIWILSQGNGTDKKPQISKWILGEDSLVWYTELSGFPSHLRLHKSEQSILFINSHIYQLNVNSPTIPSKIIDLSQFTPYAFNILNGGELYVSNVHDFVQNSTIRRYSIKGTLIHEFKAGIISGCFF